MHPRVAAPVSHSVVRRRAALAPARRAPLARGRRARPHRRADRAPRQRHRVARGGGRGRRGSSVARSAAPGTDRRRTATAPRPPARSAARPHRRHAVQRAAHGGARGARRGRAHRGAGRHRRQVPGPGGRGRDRLARGVLGRRRAARRRVPAAEEPPQRRDLAGEVGGLPHLLARAARRAAAHARGGRPAERVRAARRGRRPPTAGDARGPAIGRCRSDRAGAHDLGPSPTDGRGLSAPARSAAGFATIALAMRRCRVSAAFAYSIA